MDRHVPFPYPEGYVPSPGAIATAETNLRRENERERRAEDDWLYHAGRRVKAQRLLTTLREKYQATGRETYRHRLNHVEVLLLNHFAEQDEARRKMIGAKIMATFHLITLGHYRLLLRQSDSSRN